MSRRAIVIGRPVVQGIMGPWERVQGMYGNAALLRVWVGDRVANGEAFHAETVVRLPRRLWVERGRLGLRPAWMRHGRRALGGWS